MDGDRELLAEIIQLLLDQAPALLADVRQASAGGDGLWLSRAAHKLKGSLGPFGKKAAYGQALRLEEMGRDADLNDAGAAVETLEQEMACLTQALIAFRDEV